MSKQILEIEEMMHDEFVFMSSPKIRRSPVKKSQAMKNLQYTSARGAGIEQSGTTGSLKLLDVTYHLESIV